MGEIPNSLKLWKIVPVFKKRDKIDVSKLGYFENIWSYDEIETDVISGTIRYWSKDYYVLALNIQQQSG